MNTKNLFSIIKLGSGNLFIFISNVILIKLLSNYFTVDDFGLYSYYLILSSGGVLILFSPFTSIYSPYYYENSINQIKLRAFENQIFWRVSSVGIPIIFLLFILNLFFDFLYFEILLFASLYSLSFSILNYLDSVALVKDKKFYSFIFQISNFSLRVILIFSIFIEGIRFKPLDILFIYSIINIIVLITQIIIYRKKNLFSLYYQKPKITWNNFKSSYKYSLNVLFMSGFSFWRNFFDKFLTKHLLSNYFLGIYSVIYQYGFSVFNMFSQVLGQFLTTKFWRLPETDKSRKIYIKKTIIFSFLTIVIGVLIIYLIPIGIINKILTLLTNEEYVKYSYLIKIISVGGIFFTLNQTLATFFLRKDKIKFYNKINFIIIIFQAAILSLLINMFQLNGIVFSIPLIQAVNFFILVYYLKKEEFNIINS